MYWAGRVFLTKLRIRPCGRWGSKSLHCTYEVVWQGASKSCHMPTHGLSCVQSCVHSRVSYDKHSNMWPMERLALVKLAAVRQRTNPNRIVILSRFANLLDHVPARASQLCRNVRSRAPAYGYVLATATAAAQAAALINVLTAAFLPQDADCQSSSRYAVNSTTVTQR